MVEGTFSCPFCSAPQPKSHLTCSNCGESLPWAGHIERLHEELKEREPNRVRATATFIQEAYDASRGGRPISPAAVKGLLTSWLMPRAVIVVGSVIAGTTLVVQTWILHNQTKLLGVQSNAVRIEQGVQLRERIDTIQAYMIRLQLLTETLRRSTPYEDGMCAEIKCANANVFNALLGRKAQAYERPSREDWDNSSQLISVLEHLNFMLVPVEQSFLDKGSRTALRYQIFENSANNILLRPAATKCRSRPESFVRMSLRMELLYSLRNELLLIDSWRPNRALRTTTEVRRDESIFDQVGETIERVHSLVNGNRAFDWNTYTTQALLADLTALRLLLAASLAELKTHCQSALSEEERALDLLMGGRPNPAPLPEAAPKPVAAQVPR